MTNTYIGLVHVVDVVVFSAPAAVFAFVLFFFGLGVGRGGCVVCI